MIKRKRLFSILLLIIFVAPLFLNIPEVKAETLRDYYNELNKLKAQKQEQENAKKLTQQEYQKVTGQITDTEYKIIDGQNRIKEAKNKIVELEKEIKEKQEEINKVLNFLQISSGQNIYLEYVFGAQVLTDFIYRSSVVEQISIHNDNLINEMHRLIEENIQLQRDLAQEEKNLETLLITLSSQLKKLGSRISEYNAEALTIDEKIKVEQASINFYESQRCKIDQQINDCISMPYGTGFLRPLIQARVTDLYGEREKPTPSVSPFHRGIDLAIAEGTPVYASAPGIVLARLERTRCGGNRLYIKHTINGKYYTTEYMHLLSFNAKVGDIVNTNTIIGTVGGGSTISYDVCTTGAHLHFGIFQGWTTDNYYSLNPQDFIYFPPLDISFYSRYY